MYGIQCSCFIAAQTKNYTQHAYIKPGGFNYIYSFKRFLMQKQDLQNREDVYRLVSSFYKKVRQNPEIGYFFNQVIKDWDEHLDKLTDFWESHLFGKAIYYGNPKKAHIEVDQRNNEQISSYHFGVWLNMWFETIDELYEGERAERAKTNARKMSSNLYLKMYEARSSK